jgi:hypothetical protein
MIDQESQGPFVLAPARYVLLPLANLITGYSVKAMQRKIERGDHDLYVHGVNAHRLGDADIYCLIDGDFCLTMLGPMTHEEQVAFISSWLSLHPAAIAIPISTESRKVMRDLPPVHSTYIQVLETI